MSGSELSRGITVVFSVVIMSLSAWTTLWIGPVPYTMQNLGAVVTALLLPPWEAFTAVAFYLLLIAIGAPVAAGFRGGVYVLYGYTAGYLWGFLLSVPLASKIARVYLRRVGKSLDRISRRDFAILLCLVSLAMIPVYILGFIVFLYYTTVSLSLYKWVERVMSLFGLSFSGISAVFTASVLVFLPQDILMDHVLGIVITVNVYRYLRGLGVGIE